VDVVRHAAAYRVQKSDTLREDGTRAFRVENRKNNLPLITKKQNGKKLLLPDRWRSFGSFLLFTCLEWTNQLSTSD